MTMLALRRTKQLQAHLPQRRLAGTLQPLNAETAEYTDEPVYPKIIDRSLPMRHKRRRDSWHERIRKLPTIEEKMIKINMPRYYGFLVTELTDQKVRYNTLRMMQHYTRTHLEPMPMTFAEAESKELDLLVNLTQASVIESLEFAHDCFRQGASGGTPQPLDGVYEREKAWTDLVTEQLNRSLLQVLGPSYEHLNELIVDYKPRHEAYWETGGMDAPGYVISQRAKLGHHDILKRPVNRSIQYSGTPYLALRHRQQLPAWKSEAESSNLELANSLPHFKLDPKSLGFQTRRQHVISVPGYWPDSRVGFGLLSMQSRAALNIYAKNFPQQECDELIKALALQSTYAWLIGQAANNGFNTFNDITYPMNTQTIVTNGQQWSFFEYQLNTLLMHDEYYFENPRLNFCRTTEPLKLYEEFSADGKCIGFNPDVLRHLVRFYKNRPTVARDINELQPYVGEEARRVADYNDDEKRCFLEDTYKYLSSNRPRHLELPEIYLWEKIYKVAFNTRPMDPRRRFFELDINPWKRRLDEHAPAYIPRALRPNLKRNMGRFAKTYYP